MKALKITYEQRAYTEDEAKDAIIKFRNDAAVGGYVVELDDRVFGLVFCVCSLFICYF